MTAIELLAPAKDCETAIDAIDCGADAVYIGAARFGARYAATNSTDDIARTVRYAHIFGVRVYATLNTLLFDDELDEARRQAEELVGAGVDAFIVQDMAYCRMGLPVPLHASTQANCIDAKRVGFFEETGFARAILERSLSLDQIAQIRRDTSIELEAFVHGAICVSHSGRCFMSRSTGSRSGNRGQCSQPCRLAYDLEDMEGRTLLRGKHLLSVRDLDLSARLGEMMDAGVTSFKIEGRLKDRIYVRNIVRHYRQLLDAQLARRDGFVRSSAGRSAADFIPDPSKSFSRSAGEYFFDGKRSGAASFDTPKSTGEYIGTVKETGRGTILLDRDNDLGAGDGICCIVGGEAVGTNINAVRGRTITPNRMDGLTAGTKIYRNYCHRFTQTVGHAKIRRSIGVEAKVAMEESGITLTLTDETGIGITVSVQRPTDPAQNPGQAAEVVREQLARSGNTPFEVVSTQIDNIRFVPASVVAALRREAFGKLLNERIARHRRGAPFIENKTSKYPSRTLTARENVTNALAREFYTSHGVEHIEAGLDLRISTEGEQVMISDYCIRRETGECLREKPSACGGSLVLRRGAKRYRADFDCAACRMTLTDLGADK